MSTTANAFAIPTNPERAEVMRLALAEKELGIAAWARMEPEHARSAPAMLALIQSARRDVEAAQRAQRERGEA